MNPAVMVLLAAAASAASEDPSYRVDMTRYFPDATTEASQRAALPARVDALASSSAPPGADELLALLRTGDALRREIRRHELYVHLLAARDVEDRAAASADEGLQALLDKLDASTHRTIARLGCPAVGKLLAGNPALRPYRLVVDSACVAPKPDPAADRADALLARPALDSLSASYAQLRRAALQPPVPASAPASARPGSAGSWEPYLSHEASFAALFVPSAILQDGQARLRGFSNAADAAYAGASLSTEQVHGALAAVRQSRSWERLATVVASAAAARLHIPAEQLDAWDMDAVDTWHPPVIPFPDALARMLQAEQAMGLEYAHQFERLLDPAARRVDWCRAPRCDDAGFSVGAAGMESALFYGAFDGSTNSLRALAHEAAHAVHRQFMSEGQTIAAYNDGPKFMFESFAIFNEMLILDHLQRSAPSTAARASYLRALLDDAVFQVFGSARETALEEALHDDVAAGRSRSASDLDARTLEVFSGYTPRHFLPPETRVYWARNKLYFIDPFYDVNYLFAGLLALEYLRRFEADPGSFREHYVALLKNGFDDTPAALLRRFLRIDLDDTAGLVRGATQWIDVRTDSLASIYARCAASGDCGWR